MPEAQRVTKTATVEEGPVKGFVGEVRNAYPNDLHVSTAEQDRRDTFQATAEVPAPSPPGGPRSTAEGAAVNTDAAPQTPSGGTTGPGASQPSTAADKKTRSR